MSSAVIWVLFAAACGLLMTAGVRAKHKEQRKEDRPHKAA